MVCTTWAHLQDSRDTLDCKSSPRGASFSLKRVAPLATLADDSSTHRTAAILITAYTPEPYTLTYVLV
jgi:hypothetical protein